MRKRPAYKEPISTSLRKQPYVNEAQIIATLQWVAISSLFIFLTLLTVDLISGKYGEALVISIGVLPILVSILLLRRGLLSLPSAILSTDLILLLTWLGSIGRGIYDVGSIGYPVILILAGLILRGRVILYLSGLIILSLAWLVFGDMLGLYTPRFVSVSQPEDFFYACMIILIASNAVYLLVRNIYQSLSRAQKEIEEREKVEIEREALIQQLKLKNEELNRFAVTVSHDLKTPLITIGGFLGYLEKSALSGNKEQVQKDIAPINGAVKKMGRLVDEILDLSRVGRIMNPPRNVSMSEIVEEALKASAGLLEAKQVKVEVGSALPFVHCDRARIVQVIQNLVTNAVKFMGGQKNPMIEIGVKDRNGERVFFVRDNGMGIDLQHHEQIFGLFNKIDIDTEGSGIGLGLVRRIIEVHGGRVWVESDLGKGSIFYFTLPDNSI